MQPLRREDQYRIEANTTFLLENLQPDYISPYLLEKGIFDSSDREEVCSIVRTDNKCLRFLDILKNKGGVDGYKAFVDALVETGDFQHIVDQLNSTEVTLDKKDPWHWYQSIDDAVKSHPINDVDASRISRCLGRGWELLMKELGIRQNEIEIEKDSHRNQFTNIFNLLTKWWHRKSLEATIDVLVKTMMELDRELDVDMDKFKGVLEKIET